MIASHPRPGSALYHHWGGEQAAYGVAEMINVLILNSLRVLIWQHGDGKGQPQYFYPPGVKDPARKKTTGGSYTREQIDQMMSRYIMPAGSAATGPA